MKFSISTEYAVSSLIYLANSSTGKSTLIAEVARAIDVSEAYLRKVFQQLVRCGIVVSQRGGHGGFSLARDPSKITLKEVVEAVEGSLPFYSCLKEPRECTLGPYCLVCGVFDEAGEKMAEVLVAATIKDLGDGIKAHSDGVPWLGASV